MIKTRFPWSESYLCGMEDGERKWVISMKQQVEPFFSTNGESGKR